LPASVNIRGWSGSYRVFTDPLAPNADPQKLRFLFDNGTREFPMTYDNDISEALNALGKTVKGYDSPGLLAAATYLVQLQKYREQKFRLVLIAQCCPELASCQPASSISMH
jgi:hypothetical protein